MDMHFNGKVETYDSASTILIQEKLEQ